MRTNFVGRWWVSAITHTPASGPFGPVTTPAMSAAPMGTPWAARGQVQRPVARPTIATAARQSRVVLMFPPLTSVTPDHPRTPVRPRVITPTLLIANSSSPPVPLSAYAERGDDERASRSKASELVASFPLSRRERGTGGEDSTRGGQGAGTRREAGKGGGLGGAGSRGEAYAHARYRS